MTENTEYQFVDFHEITGDDRQYTLGIIRAKLFKKMVVCYRVIPKKAGGFFIGEVSFKFNGEWKPAQHFLDKEFDKEVKAMLYDKASQYLSDNEKGKGDLPF